MFTEFFTLLSHGTKNYIPLMPSLVKEKDLFSSFYYFFFYKKKTLNNNPALFFKHIILWDLLNIKSQIFKYLEVSVNKDFMADSFRQHYLNTFRFR